MYRIEKLNAVIDLKMRCQIMSELSKRAASVPTSWHIQRAEYSLTMTSPDKKKIIKIDAHKVYTLDVKKPDGTYKSARFSCASIEEAWTMAIQAVKVHRCSNANN